MQKIGQFSGRNTQQCVNCPVIIAHGEGMALEYFTRVLVGSGSKMVDQGCDETPGHPQETKL